MSGKPGDLFGKMVRLVFPNIPDFYAMLDEQLALLVQATALFEELMATNQPEIALKIRELEHQGDQIKTRNIAALRSAFNTPIDREDIYRAIMSIDMVVNYAKTSVREMEMLAIEPDPHMNQMAGLLREGAEALRRGYAKLADTPALADEDALAVAKAERMVEKCFRRALTELFDPKLHLLGMQGQDPSDLRSEIMESVMLTLKRREIYRHLSNAADQLAHAGTVLHDISVQIS